MQTPHPPIPRSARTFTVEELENTKIRHAGFLMQTTFTNTKRFDINLSDADDDKIWWHFNVDFIAYSVNLNNFGNNFVEPLPSVKFSDVLVDDVYTHIFKFLHDRDLSNVRLASKSFNHLSTTEYMYSILCKNAFSVHADQVTTTWKEFYRYLMRNFETPKHPNEQITGTYKLVYSVTNETDLSTYDEKPLKHAFTTFCQMIFGGSAQYRGCHMWLDRSAREFVATLFFAETGWNQIPDEIAEGFDVNHEASWAMLILILLRNTEQLLPALNLAGIISDSYSTPANSAFKSVILGDIPRYFCGVEIDEVNLKTEIRKDGKWTKMNIKLLASTIPDAKLIVINTPDKCISFRFDKSTSGKGFPFFEKLAETLISEETYVEDEL
jgi:hypothetical protein